MKHEFIQTRNPKTGLWVKVDKTEEKIVSTKKTSYKNIPIARLDKKMYLSKPEIDYEVEEIEISKTEDTDHFYPVCKCEICKNYTPFSSISSIQNGELMIEYYCLKCSTIFTAIKPVGYVSYADLQLSGWSYFL